MRRAVLPVVALAMPWTAWAAVTPPTVSATPAQLDLTCQLGATPPTAQITVGSVTSGLTYTASAAASSGGSWLSLNKTAGVTPDALNILINPAGLAAGNSYQGTVTVSGAGSAAGSSIVTVSLAVTAPPPAISSVVNAASFLGGPLSPGEMVSIFGSNLGPAAPAGLTLDAGGKVSTILGGSQVLFNGIPAPLTYVSLSQINCVVPYEFAQAAGNPNVQVKSGAQTSLLFFVRQSSAAPAIFTASNGVGQGAILNADNSYNGAGPGALPAPKGSTVQIYLTGGGAANPPQATGSVTCSSGCAAVSAIPRPALPIAVLVNNQPATFTFAGEAPGFVSGVLQVDVTIPPGVPSGAIPIMVLIGGVSSQAGVTVLVQ